PLPAARFGHNLEVGAGVESAIADGATGGGGVLGCVGVHGYLLRLQLQGQQHLTTAGGFGGGTGLGPAGAGGLLPLRLVTVRLLYKLDERPLIRSTVHLIFGIARGRAVLVEL